MKKFIEERESWDIIYDVINSTVVMLWRMDGLTFSRVCSF